MHRVAGKVKRPDGQGLRHEQVELTERRIVEAAQRLFVERGYAAATLAEVAEAAGVAPRTVYVRFGTKARLLDRCMGASVVGDLGSTPLLQRPEMLAMFDSPRLEDRISGFVQMGTAIMRRTGPLLVVAAQAAAIEPEIAALEQGGMHRALGDLEAFAKALDADGLLPPGLDVDLVTNVLWTCAGPRAVISAITDRGWSPAQFSTWLETVLRWFFRLA
jgi:AcrR family transcriptional regulator